MAKKIIPKKTKRVRRKKPAFEASSEINQDVARASSQFLTETIKTARTEYGDSNIAVASEADRIVIGIPMPSLAMEYLIQNDVWPLGRFAQINGTEGTCKSALTFEMCRWFRNSSGIGYLLENETKYSPDFAQSIIGYPENEGEEVLGHIPCNSLEDWQEKLQRTAGWCRERMSRDDVGRKFPVLLILDSLMGKSSLESQAKIEKDGFADRSHPVEALKLNSFMKKFPQDLEEWPMFFLFVNHLKPAKSQNGPHLEYNKAGGRAPSFQETFEIRMSKRGKISLVDDNPDGGMDIGGLNLTLRCVKNSLGETDRKIDIDVKWTTRLHKPSGEMRQYTVWDWPAATVALLATFDKGARKEKIASIVDIHKISAAKYWSNKLGVDSKNPINPHDLGVMLEADEKIKKGLRRLFGIKRRKVFAVGEDYLDQLNRLRETAEMTMNDEEDNE